MLDLAGKQPVLQKPEVNLRSTEQPSLLPDYLAGGLVVLVGLITLIFFFVSRATVKSVASEDATYQTLNQELTSGRFQTISAQAGRINQAVRLYRSMTQNQVIWSMLLKSFQTSTTNGITLLNVSVDEKNLVKIEARATDFTTLAKYLATLKNTDLVSHVDLVSSNLAEGKDSQSVSFVLGLELDAAKLKAASQGGQR